MNIALPVESFISFEARRVKNPKLLWAREPAQGPGCVAQYAWCLPIDGEHGAEYAEQSTTLRAERYGGTGVGSNGGGVRVGLHADHHVKGIGRTDLCGAKTSFAHSYGGSTANAAVREAIWGEVFNMALPFGAVVAKAIILTGSELPGEGADTATRQRRALLVRPNFLRPAHYLRASLFKPTASFRARWPSDADRVRVCARRFGAGVSEALQYASRSNLPELLAEAYRRFAWQIAAARAKRLVHSSLSASNIAMDGRFVDFGGASGLSDHGRIIVAPGCPDAWSQHEPLHEAILDLVLQLSKYGQLKVPPNDLIDSLRAGFLKTLKSRFQIELVKLLGVPESQLTPADIGEAYPILWQLVEAGNTKRFQLRPPCDSCSSHGERMGAYHLGTILKALVNAESETDADRAISGFIQDVPIRVRLVQTSFAIWARCAGTRPGQEKQVRSYLRFNVHRQNASLSSLHFFPLKSRVDRLLREDGDVQSFIDRLVSSVALRVMNPHEDGSIRSADGRVFASPGQGCLLDDAPADAAALCLDHLE